MAKAQYQATGEKVLDAALLGALLTVKQFADMVGASPAQVRRAARKGEIPGVYLALGRIGIDAEAAKGWEPPEPGEFAARRADGRSPYRVYATDEEKAQIVAIVGTEQVVDPRAKRAARKAAKAKEAASVAAEADEEGDPFKDFNLDE